MQILDISNKDNKFIKDVIDEYNFFRVRSIKERDIIIPPELKEEIKEIKNTWVGLRLLELNNGEQKLANVSEIYLVKKNENKLVVELPNVNEMASANENTNENTNENMVGGNKTYTVKELKNIAIKNKIKITKKKNEKTVNLNKQELITKLKRHKVI